MPRPWSVNAAVQIKVGTVWVNANVSSVIRPNQYDCTITTNPRPTLAACGILARYTPNTAQIQPNAIVSDTPHLFGNTTIRDPI